MRFGFGGGRSYRFKVEASSPYSSLGASDGYDLRAALIPAHLSANPQQIHSNLTALVMIRVLSTNRYLRRRQTI